MKDNNRNLLVSFVKQHFALDDEDKDKDEDGDGDELTGVTVYCTAVEDKAGMSIENTLAAMRELFLVKLKY
jgi:hypothetical protein